MKTRDDILRIQKAPQSMLGEYLAKNQPFFGTEFTDHMLVMDLYSEDWQDEIAQIIKAEIVPYGPISLSPATVGLHYGQVVFEGMMAFQDQQGILQLFRPNDHLYRLNTGAQRLGMPRIDVDFLLHAIGRLVTLDRLWIDRNQRRALYLRPIFFAADPYIGVRSNSMHFKLIVFATPHTNYGDDTLKLYLPRPSARGTEPEFMRSYPRDTGDIKAAANYAATIAPLRTAEDHGCNDILWLDSTGVHLQEAGTSNVFFQIGEKVITPPLDGTILPGITRASVLTLLRASGTEVEERAITLAELQAAGSQLKEAFATGTASTIKPIIALDSKDGLLQLNPAPNSLAINLKTQLQAILWGIVPDAHQWLQPINPLVCQSPR